MQTNDSIATRESLLERLKDWDDRTGWQTFFHRYWRFIYNVAIRAGLNDAEAQDVVQETMLSVARNIEGFTYDPKVCSFKTWMLRVTRWRILDYFERKQREHPIAALPTGEAPTGQPLDDIWEEEWRKHVLHMALEEVKRKIGPLPVQIFDLRVNQGWSVKEVASSLGISPARIYLAKHRVGRLMRKAVETIESRGE